MGHRDSSTHYGCDGEFFGAHRRTGEAVAPRIRRGEIHGVSEKVKSAGAWILLGFLRCYQIFLGPFLGGACKFYPSCSNYAYQAVQRHGARRGIVLAMKRLGRCRPFTSGGFDPVPDTIEKNVSGKNSWERLVSQGNPFIHGTREEEERAR